MTGWMGYGSLSLCVERSCNLPISLNICAHDGTSKLSAVYKPSSFLNSFLSSFSSISSSLF